MYFYSLDSGKFDSKGFNPLECDATRCFLEHYSNELVLTFFSNNGTIQEKHQAEKELVVCKRKQQYWKRQPHFDNKLSLSEQEKMNKVWQNKHL